MVKFLWHLLYGIYAEGVTRISIHIEICYSQGIKFINYTCNQLIDMIY